MPTITMKSQYNYERLSPGQFRLFELLPSQRGTSSGIPAGRLLTVDAQNHPNFEVISYLWGPKCSEDEPISVECDGQFIDTSPNLIVALQTICHQSKRQFLWIDAVCINQQDRDEQSSQLLMSHRIISMARSVIVYVNSASESTRAALRLASQLITAHRTAFGHVRSPLLFTTTNQFEMIQRYRELLPSSKSTAWKAMNNLLGERAFER